jgi:orotate phosphoribosyltransferase
MTLPASQVNAIANRELSNRELSTVRQQLLDLFVDLAYQEGDFVLSSGQTSPYYINGKLVSLTAEGALFLGRLLLDRLPQGTQAVAGLTLGADPLVTAVSVVSAYQNRPIPALIVRKEAKGHGTQAFIEGPTLPVGAKIVVLEDVVTTGRSALQAVDRLQAVGYQVDRIIAVVDRLQGGEQFYQEQGIAFESLFNITDIQRAYHQKQARINPVQS